MPEPRDPAAPQRAASRQPTPPQPPEPEARAAAATPPEGGASEAGAALRTPEHPGSHVDAKATPALVLSCLGVVFGDIGTSPLYALRESLVHAHEHHMAETAVIGIVSMLFWTVVLIVTLKYVTLILRADNNGEGGTLSLVAKAQGALGRRRGGSISSASWACRCSSATRSSRRPCRSCRPSRGWTSSCRASATGWCR